MTNYCRRKPTMTTSETKSGAQRGALLLGKSKPKVKIRSGPPKTQTSRHPEPTTASVSSRKWSPELVIYGALLVALWLLISNNRLATCRAHNGTGHQDRPEVDGRQIRELVAMAAGGSSASSELSFEYLNLRHIPSGQLCQLGFQSQVNSVSFASNQIKSIDSSAFICISLQLKILNLRNNRIESISEEAFKGLSQLQVLVLDGNQLGGLPWKQLADSYLPSLRHLSLAHNKISSIGADEVLAGSSLISLNLRGNPLQRIHWNSLKGLAKLKTLILTQVDLQASRLERFGGLPELRFVHLDQLGQNLSSLDGQFCESSRKLATLSLKLNRLEQVPRFTSCHGLLSLDLSYNRIQGTLAANFSRLNNLVDLYLGHNQLEHLDESAFVGLNKLQVLELNSNRIKTIHSNAFVPLRATLYELNIAHNIQLSELTSNGLERLISLKSYGNNQLRKLPAEFPSARLLVLTFAYHCCDYYHQGDHHHHANSTTELAAVQGSQTLGAAATGSRGEIGEEDARLAIHHGSSGPRAGVEDKRDDRSLASRWSNLVLSKLAQIWPTSNFLSGGRNEELAVDQTRAGPNDDQSDETANARNMSELVLWRRSRGGTGSKAPAPQAGADNADDDEYFRTLNLQQRDDPLTGAEDRERARPETLATRRRQPRRRRRRERAEPAPSQRAAVIDELIWQASKIRSAHLQAPDGQPIKRMAQDDDEQLPLLAAAFGQIGANDLVEDPDELGPGLRAELVARALGDELSRRYSSSVWLAARPAKRAAADGQDESRRPQAPSDRRHPVQCLPRPDAFQPCRDLFDSVWLRASISLVFLFAFAGNILVIVVLSSVKPSSSTSALTSIMWLGAAQSKRHIDVPRFLVINLAVADLLMAIYLGLLAFIDLSTLGEFRQHAIKWQYSTGCKLAGFLAVLSSELSVFILAIITLERNYAITNAVHLNRRLSLQKAMVIMFFGYLYALTMAILPLNGINDYRKFSICLPLDFDPNNLRSASSLYLISLISINTLSFVLLLSCYLRMYCAIRGSQAWSTNDLKIAKRMSILVVTDFLCWSPIIFVATLSLLGYYLVGAEGLKVLIIFVLPLNSVANPFLYAITTKKFKRDLATLKKRLRVEQTLQALTRALAHLAPICCSRRGTGASVGASKHQSASWTVRADTGFEQIYNKNAARRSNKLKRSPTDYRLVMDDTRAVGGKQRPRGRLAKAATATTRQELLLVNQNGRSVLANGYASQMGSSQATRLIQFRSTAVDRLEQADGISDGFLAKADHVAQGRIVVTHCAACRSRLVPRLQTVRPLELSSTAGLVSTRARQASESNSDSGAPQLVTRPRIVLDSVEPPLELALDSMQSAGDQCSHHLLAADTDGTHRSWPLGECAEGHQLHMHHVACRKLSASDTIDMQHRQALIGEQQKRASSADKPQNGSHMMSLIADHVDCKRRHNAQESRQRLFEQHSVGSCQAASVRGTSANYRQAHNINLLDCGSANMGAPSNRSVSACAFEWPNVSSGTQSDARQQTNYLTAATHRACCSCSCDAIRVGSVRSGAATNVSAKRATDINQPVGPAYSGRESVTRGRTRSFSRFVFEPLAKAWSSLQLSLQLGPAHTGAVATVAATKLASATGQAVSQPAAGPTSIPASQWPTNQQSQRCMAAANDGIMNEHELDSESTENDELLVDFHESSIIEDVLQMSSPKRRQLLKGRRMSRSCDVIVETSTTTTTGAELTSSSFYDQNDDQRILLATINQLNSRGRKKRKQSSIERQPDDNQQVQELTSSGSRRLNCTRCRSWSPALLDKLEDCMHQIRNRIPKFKRVGNQEQHPKSGGSQMQQQPIEACSTGDQPDKVTKNERQPSCSSSSQCSSSLNLSEAIDDEEEDGFTEVGLADWARNMQKKAPANCYSKSISRRHRLRQQLSGNSDTLSARTVGTTLTSVSFDSSSNIPVNVSGSMEDAVHQVVSSSSLDTPSNDAKTTDNESCKS